MVNAKDFVSQVLIPYKEGWGYIYGTWGELWTESAQARINKTTDSNREKSRQYGSKWIGKMVTDCSGLVRYALYRFGVNVVHHALYLYTDYCKNKGQLSNGRRSDGSELRPGSLVFLKGSRAKIHHVGVYIGDGKVIEAKGAQFGVIESAVDSGWDYWGELEVIDFTNQSTTEVRKMLKATVVSDAKTLNLRVGPSKTSGLVYQIPKGASVQVLDTSDPKWYKIKYGRYVGYSSTQYLKLQNEDPVSVVEEPTEVVTEPEMPAKSQNEILNETMSAVKATINGLMQEINALEQLLSQLVK